MEFIHKLLESLCNFEFASYVHSCCNLSHRPRPLFVFPLLMMLCVRIWAGVEPVLFHVLPDEGGVKTLAAAPARTAPVPLPPAPSSIDTDTTTDHEWSADDTASEGHLTPTPLDAYASSTAAAVAVAEGLIQVEPGRGSMRTESNLAQSAAVEAEATAGEKRKIASIDFAVLSPEGQKRFRVSLQQQRLMSLAFSAMFTVALMQQEQAPIHTGGGDLSRRQLQQTTNLLGLYHDPDDDNLLVGAHTLRRGGTRLVNIGHRHGFVYAMLAVAVFNLVFVPLGGWFQTKVIEGIVGWDMYEFKMRRVGRGPKDATVKDLLIWTMHWTIQNFVRLYCSWSVVLLLLHFPVAVYTTKGVSSKGEDKGKSEPLAFGWFRAFWLFTFTRVFWLTLTFDLVAESFRLWMTYMPSYKVQLPAIGTNFPEFSIGTCEKNAQ